ncbi:ribonuclease SLFN12-like [Urocitellus parryii]
MATVDMNMYGLGDSMWQAEKVPPGVKNEIEMEDRRLRKRQNDSLSEDTSALPNSGGKVMKPEIERKEDNKDGIGQDLDQSLHNIQSYAQNDLESMQDPEEILNLLKPGIENSSGMSIFTLQTNLYQRNVTHTVVMNASSALDFLRERKSRSRSYSRSQLHTKRAPDDVQEEIDLEKKAAEFFNMREPIHKKHLDLTESTNVEMKFFSTGKALQRIKEIVARSVSAFGNTDGGYLFVGLNAQEIERSGPERKRRYFSKIESEIEKHISRLPVYHFCKEKAKINYSCKFLEVHDEGGLHRYFCALHVERFCCAVFAKEPILLEKKKPVLYLTVEECIKYLMDAKQGFSSLSKEACLPPAFSPYPVLTEKMRCVPEALCRELFSQEEALEQLVQKETGSAGQGILIFSRSWSVDLHLPKNEEVICDVLLISKDNPPVLYTFLRMDEELENGSTLHRELDEKIKGYSSQTAQSLKQMLVKLGNYTEKICIMTKIFCLSPKGKIIAFYDSSEKAFYPASYYVATFETMVDQLKALFMVLKKLRSVSEQWASEIFNWTGGDKKSANASSSQGILKFSRSRAVDLDLQAKQGVIWDSLLIPLNSISFLCIVLREQDAEGNKRIWEAVSQKTFMKRDFEDIQHITVDEAQNFHIENGDLYGKSKAITQREKEAQKFSGTF